MSTAKIHSVETMGALDGPGLRYVLFLKGCPLRCAFCHNPDTWGASGFTEKSAKEVADDIFKYREFFQATGGGFTASGGEPLLQAEFLLELIEILKSENISTAIDTCGYIDITKDIEKIVQLADIFLFDIKHLDPAEHKKLTTKTNEKIFKFLDYISESKKEIHIRIVLVNNVSASEEYISGVAKFLKKYPTITRIDLLLYHTLGIEKWKSLGIPYKLDDSALVPDDLAKNAKKILEAEGFCVTLQ